MIMIKRTVSAILIMMIIMVPLAGCSSKSSSSQVDGSAQGTVGTDQQGAQGTRQNGNYSKRDTSSGASGGNYGGNYGGTPGETSNGGGASGQTQILGKVTSIIGNEVVLAIGTQASKTSTSELALTGESKTLLIPVGLTLSGVGMGSSAASGFSGAAGAGAAGAGAAGGGAAGGGAAGGTTGASTNRTSTTRASTTTRTGASTQSSSSSKSSSTVTKSGFSSITTGMVLRIAQKTINGTLAIVKVTVVSK